MAKHVFYAVIVLVSFTEMIAQSITKDSIVVRSFGPRDYKAALFNFSTVEDENGIIYTANENGVLEYDGSEWHLIRIKNYSGAIKLEASPDGKIYVGGLNEFGYLERNASGQFEYNSVRDLVDSTLKINEIWQIYFFENQVYFQSYESIIRFDGETANVIPIKDTWLLPLNNEMYVSTYNKGIGILNKDSTKYINEGPKFKDDGVFKLLPGPDGKQLALTEFHGVFLVDTTDFSFQKWNVPVNEGLIKYGLYDGIVWDDSTYVFSGIDKGVVWANSSGDSLRVINKDNGISTNYMCELFQDTRGNLWLPTDGLNYLTWPDKQGIENFNTLLRYIEVDDSSTYVNTTSGDFIINQHGPIGSLVFHFATPGYDKIDLEYSYYLEGYEGNWSAWKSDVKKEYTNLEDGSYIFHVKARLQNGKVSTPASINFNIPILWYQTSWAYALAVLVLSLLIWIGIRIRTIHLKTLNKRLEEIIKDRTKELVTQREQLYASNEELIVTNNELDNFVYRSSHDLIAPLKSLKGLINITQNEKAEKNRITYFKMMNTSIAKLEEFIKSILEYSTNANGEIDKREIDLNQMLDSVVDDLVYFDNAQKVALKRHFDKNLTFVSDPKRVKIIISNLIANAIKYHDYSQQNPHIEVTATRDNGQLNICIADNGQGIDSEHLNKIFNMFYRGSDSSEGSGLGLYIVRDTIQKLNGDISVESTINEGTTFSLTFNLS